MFGKIGSRTKAGSLLSRLAPARVLAHGLPALIIGGAFLLAVIWVAALEMTGTLARMQVQQQLAHVAAKLRDVVREEGRVEPSRKVPAALAHLVRFHDLEYLELRDAAGRPVWRSDAGAFALIPAERTKVRPGEVAFISRIVDGARRVLARHDVRVKTPAGMLEATMLKDVTDTLVAYRRIGVLVAKAFSTIVLLAVFLMGWLIILRWREQRTLVAEIAALLQAAREGGSKDAERWQRLVEQASRENAALLRQVLELVKDTGPEAEMDARGRRGEADTSGQRAAG